MDFRTQYPTDCTKATQISHDDRIWLIGSCFSDNVGEMMRREGFDTEVNPLGTLYNPASIARALDDVAARRIYKPEEMILNEGRWHSLMHHSRFSADAATGTADNINTAIARLHNALPSLNTLILTLGSAMMFVDNITGDTVANCHKLHPSRFRLEEMPIPSIVNTLANTIGRLRATAPSLRVILTVSPIRHKGYGPVRDRLSKSRLLLAADTLCHTLPEVYYFGAYDIMMDDLRDYRFYAADMIHPSETAVAYIYQLFADTYYSADTRRRAADALRSWRRSAHRQ